jgi:DivIVA domain-containing protein
MNDRIQLTVQKILDKKFTRDVKGYNPDEVDAFLDMVIQDYVSYTEAQKQQETTIVSLQNQVAALQQSDPKLNSGPGDRCPQG